MVVMWGFMSSDVGWHIRDKLYETLKSKDEWGGGGGGRVALASVRVIMSGGQQGAYCCIKNTFCRWDSILLRIKNDDHLLTAVDGPVMRAAYIKNC